MKYKYTGQGAFFSGLPATDLDDADLTDEQKQLLEVAVSAGLYQPVTPPARAKKEKPTNDEETGV